MRPRAVVRRRPARHDHAAVGVVALVAPCAADEVSPEAVRPGQPIGQHACLKSSLAQALQVDVLANRCGLRRRFPRCNTPSKIQRLRLLLNRLDMSRVARNGDNLPQCKKAGMPRAACRRKAAATLRVARDKHARRASVAACADIAARRHTTRRSVGDKSGSLESKPRASIERTCDITARSTRSPSGASACSAIVEDKPRGLRKCTC